MVTIFFLIFRNQNRNQLNLDSVIDAILSPRL